jgi:hypothetical protein
LKLDNNYSYLHTTCHHPSPAPPWHQLHVQGLETATWAVAAPPSRSWKFCATITIWSRWILAVLKTHMHTACQGKAVKWD